VKMLEENLAPANPFKAVQTTTYSVKSGVDEASESSSLDTLAAAPSATPTSLDTIGQLGSSLIEATPFTIEFRPTSDKEESDSNEELEIDEESIIAASDVAVKFLAEYLKRTLKYESSTVEAFVSKVVNIDVRSSLNIAYKGSVELSEDSFYFPTRPVLDQLIASAFLQPSVETLLLLLGNLPDENPLSMVSTVTYSAGHAVSSQLKVEDPPSKDTSATVGTILGALSVVFVVGAFVYQKGQDSSKHGLCMPGRGRMPGRGSDHVEATIEDSSDCASFDPSDIDPIYPELDGDDDDDDDDGEIEFQPSDKDPYSPGRPKSLFDAPFTSAQTSFRR
jgi:hypothetical protein